MPNAGGVVDEPRQILARHAERHVDLVQLAVPKAGVVDQRAEAVADRIGDHAVDLRLGVDLVVVVDLGHLLEAELARRQRPLVMERGVGERRAELAGQDPRGNADVAHAQADRRHLAAARPVRSIRRLSCGWLAIVAILTMSGSQLAQPAVDLLEIVGRLAEVVQADDPLGLAEARNRAGDVFFQVDVLDALGDRRPQQQQPLLLAAGELAAVGGAAAGDRPPGRAGRPPAA